VPVGVLVQHGEHSGRLLHVRLGAAGGRIHIPGASGHEVVGLGLVRDLLGETLILDEYRAAWFSLVGHSPREWSDRDSVSRTMSRFQRRGRNRPSDRVAR